MGKIRINNSFSTEELYEKLNFKSFNAYYEEFGLDSATNTSLCSWLESQSIETINDFIANDFIVNPCDHCAIVDDPRGCQKAFSDLKDVPVYDILNDRWQCYISQADYDETIKSQVFNAIEDPKTKCNCREELSNLLTGFYNTLATNELKAKVNVTDITDKSIKLEISMSI